MFDAESGCSIDLGESERFITSILMWFGNSGGLIEIRSEAYKSYA